MGTRTITFDPLKRRSIEKTSYKKRTQTFAFKKRAVEQSSFKKRSMTFELC